MPSLFSASDNQAIIYRINNLTDNSVALWGKMNAAQMLAHCRVPLRVAFGEQKLSKNLIGILFGKWVKKQMVNDKPFKHDLPTDKRFIVTQTAPITKEKEDLIGLVQRFTQGPGVLSNQPHPFFGKLTSAEWDILAFKHLDHHLRQFGV